MPGLDAGGTGRRHLAGRRAVLGGAGRGANAAAAGRLDRSSAPGPCSGGGRPAGRAARGTVARHRAGGTNPGDRSLPPRRLGARGQHALRPRPALFEAAAPRSLASRRVLAGLLGRSALRAAGRAAVHDPGGADDRAGRRRARTSLRRRPHRRGDQTGLSSGRRPGDRPRAAASAQACPRAERSPAMPFRIRSSRSCIAPSSRQSSKAKRFTRRRSRGRS